MTIHISAHRKEAIAKQSRRFVAAISFLSFFALSFILAAMGKAPLKPVPAASDNPQVNTVNGNSVDQGAPGDLAQTSANLDGSTQETDPSQVASDQAGVAANSATTATNKTGQVAQTTSQSWSATGSSQTTAAHTNTTVALATTTRPATTAPTTTRPPTPTTTVSAGS